MLVLALLAAGVAAYRFEWGQRYLPWLAADPVTEPEAVLPPAGLDLPDWVTPAASAEAADSSAPIVPDKVAAAVTRDLADPDLGRHVVGAVSSLQPGSETWTSGDGRYLPASTTKLLTLGAALATMGPDQTFTTRVVRGDKPREVVLVGGGDPLLASKPLTVAEADATYPARADVSSLALQAAAALGGTGRVKVRFDDSLFSGPTDNPAWRRDYVPDDIASPITALMVDSGIAPDRQSRSDDPSLAAAQVLASALGAALATLGPDHTFTTKVVRGAGPREVVLVGGGDPLLASQPLSLAEAESTYPTRADVTTLALTAAKALGGRGRVKVRFDDSLFTGPTDNPAWRRDYVPDDIASPITALMVDSGIAPDRLSRSDDPSLAAAQVLASALAAAGLRGVGQPERLVAPPGTEELASVESAPLSEIAERIIDVSDNEGAEVVGHQVGLAVSGTGSFEGGAAAVLDTLGGLGIDVSGDEVYDGSGLSRRNRVSTATLLALLQRAAGPDGEAMRSLVTGLPVAGFTGSLTYRFEDGPPVARGLVRAKTGTLTGVHALAGIAVGRDGEPMAFVLGADKSPDAKKLDAQQALDRAAAALAACRCSQASG